MGLGVGLSVGRRVGGGEGLGVGFGVGRGVGRRVGGGVGLGVGFGDGLGVIPLAIGGLYMLQDSEYGGLALGAIVVGVFIFMTEPMRLQVIGAKTGVFASTLGDGDQTKLARDQLGYAYRERAIYEAVIALAVVGVLYFI